MIKLNEEQKAARSLQWTNTIISILALIPALLCWVFTVGLFSEKNQEMTPTSQEITFFICSSVLLIVFYGYTIFSPRIHLDESYFRKESFWYWMIVLITNLLTALLFVSISFWQLAIVPAIPFLFAVDGLIAHIQLNSKKCV